MPSGRVFKQRICATLAVFACCLSGNGVHAADRVQLSLGTIVASGWQLTDAVVTLDWTDPARTTLVFEAATARVGEYRFQQIHFDCTHLDMQGDVLDCREGRLGLHGDDVKAENVPATLRYTRSSGALTFKVERLALAGGRVNLTIKKFASGWQVDAAFAPIGLTEVAVVLKNHGYAMPGWHFQGRIAGALSLRGNSAGLSIVEWNLRTLDAGYSNASGGQAGEALQLASRGSAEPAAGAWRVKASLQARSGMLFAEPVYLEFNHARPLSLSLAADWRASSRQLSVQSLTFSQPDVANGRLRASLSIAAEPRLQQLDLTLDDARLPGLYTTWLQPWLAGTILADLDTAGRLQGRLRIAEGRPQALHLALEELSVQAKTGQFGVQKLNGALEWKTGGDVRRSTVAWQAANLYRLQFGAASVALETGAEHLKLLQPLVVPLFDGALHVDDFRFGWAAGKPDWSLDAMLTPVSMPQVSRALGWLSLAGTLSGMVPRMRYQDGELSLGGVLLVQAFDGDITLRNLRIRDPLGLVPRLWTDIRIDHLDLKTLTGAFSFGRIDGRLQGRVDKLYMEAWQPVAFDAEVGTPPGDNSRHRISQRAVDNISNLGGGGVAGAVSRSFLRFLKDFPYKRLGIRCRLAAGVCHMGGVAPADNGYYLVEGRWLPPRLDVIGYAREVDWTSLLARLTAITHGELPQVR